MLKASNNTAPQAMPLFDCCLISAALCNLLQKQHSNAAC